MYCSINPALKSSPPPLAHRWVLDRNKKISKKKYHSYQKDAPDSASIDGLIDDWRTTHATKIGNIGFFKIFWSGSHIFLAARIFDSSITYKDFVEIHFDLYNNKNEFAGINHRSISFGPKLRSNCFTVNLTDSGFTLVDSINVLISREMRWSKKTYPDGYSIEVSLPIFVLSDLQYPQKMIGFDISVIDVDDNSDKETFTSWSGTEITNRYNPSQWGNLILEQAMYPLRLMVLIGLTLFSILIAAVIVIQLVQYYKNRKIDLKDQQGYSESMNNILQHIQQSMSDPELSAATVASELCSTPEEINSIIQKETDCTFEQFVNYHKIKTARMLLRETEYTLERIAEITGLRSLDKFNKFFTESTRVTPEKYRQRKLEESEDNDNENG
ncbi:MAG TPA: helix-turn-helix domain-containing protein [Chitinispirillaceae bacterium]|nr:helix-turn-helix domain-containing protein [Chitinispirillaceae bacterium]